MAIIDGNEGPNAILDTVDDDFIRADEGNDTITSSYGRDTVNGDAGDDVLILAWSDATAPVYTDDSRALPGTRAYVDTNGSWAESTRKVLSNGIEHYVIASGPFDDRLVGWPNAWDVIDGGPGADLWRDSFSASSAGMVVDMAQIATDDGVLYPDGTEVRNLEYAVLSLTQGNDTFRDNGVFDDSVSARGGDDIVRFSYGNDSADGDGGTSFNRESGEDILVVDYGDATRTVFVGNDRSLPGTRVYEYPEGGDAWADATRSVLHNAFEHYDVTTGSGDDILNGWTGAWDRFDGGAGTDSWRDSFAGWTDDAGISVTLGRAATARGERYADGTVVRNIEAASLTLTPLDDSFRDTGNHGDGVAAGEGDDTVRSAGGVDFHNGGPGDDVLVLSYGDATRPVYTDNSRGLPGTRAYVYPEGSDAWADATRGVQHNEFEHYDVTGGRADDWFNGWFNAWDKFDGRAGLDTWRDSFSAYETGLTVSMSQAQSKRGLGLPDGTEIRRIERVDLTLTDHDDRYVDARAYDDIVRLGAGDDRAVHKNGADYIGGGDGDDRLTIEWGGVRTDIAVNNYRFDTSAQADRSLGFFDNPRRVDFDGFEHITARLGRGDDVVRLGDWEGRDVVSLNLGNDYAEMGAGDDRAKGGGGRDTIDGGPGIDVLEGGRGADILIGGDGDDVMVGYQGADRFVYRDLDEGRDTILTFQPGLDLIDLTALRLTEADVAFRSTPSGALRLVFGDTVVTFDEIARPGTVGLDDIDFG